LYEQGSQLQIGNLTYKEYSMTTKSTRYSTDYPFTQSNNYPPHEEDSDNPLITTRSQYPLAADIPLPPPSLVDTVLKTVYDRLSSIFSASVLTYITGRCITRLHLNPLAGAKFTAIASTSCIVWQIFIRMAVIKRTREEEHQAISILREKFNAGTLAAIIVYGLYAYVSPEKSLRSFMKASTVAISTFGGVSLASSQVKSMIGKQIGSSSSRSRYRS
jgi:hypothetical protein